MILLGIELWLPLLGHLLRIIKVVCEKLPETSLFSNFRHIILRVGEWLVARQSWAIDRVLWTKYREPIILDIEEWGLISRTSSYNKRGFVLFRLYWGDLVILIVL